MHLLLLLVYLAQAFVLDFGCIGSCFNAHGAGTVTGLSGRVGLGVAEVFLYFGNFCAGSDVQCSCAVTVLCSRFLISSNRLASTYMEVRETWSYVKQLTKLHYDARDSRRRQTYQHTHTITLQTQQALEAFR